MASADTMTAWKALTKKISLSSLSSGIGENKGSETALDVALGNAVPSTQVSQTRHSASTEALTTFKSLTKRFSLSSTTTATAAAAERVINEDVKTTLETGSSSFRGLSRILDDFEDKLKLIPSNAEQTTGSEGEDSGLEESFVDLTLKSARETFREIKQSIGLERQESELSRADEPLTYDMQESVESLPSVDDIIACMEQNGSPSARHGAAEGGYNVKLFPV